jgi:hypothetical protein
MGCVGGLSVVLPQHQATLHVVDYRMSAVSIEETLVRVKKLADRCVSGPALHSSEIVAGDTRVHLTRSTISRRRFFFCCYILFFFFLNGRCGYLYGGKKILERSGVAVAQMHHECGVSMLHYTWSPFRVSVGLVKADGCADARVDL